MEHMTETIKLQLEHRSYRAFKDQALTKGELKALQEVARSTPSSMGQQRVSVIRITDANLRSAISQICKQDYHQEAAEFWVFVVDLYRNYKIAEEQGVDLSKAVSTDKFFQGFTDAVLLAQNVAVAAESMGLGTVMVGSILNDLPQLIKLLNLPQFTLPALAISIGWPAQQPDKKPRLPLSHIFMENSYQDFQPYLTSLAAYDAEMRQYYDLRNSNQRVESFSLQVAKFASLANPQREAILSILKEQGFTLELA